MFDLKGKQLSEESQLYGGILGLCVGDALGVPFEFMDRSYIKNHPCRTMTVGGIHNQKLGTWSDDSSLTLCTIDSLINGYDIEDIGRKFSEWLYDKLWTPYGNVFDVGGATRSALKKIRYGRSAKESGEDSAYSNGNGSLMRILPLAYYLKDFKGDKFKIVEEVSAITHSNIISKISCSIYVELTINLLKGMSKKEAYESMKPVIIEYYNLKGFSDELSKFDRLLKGDISKYREKDIKSDGYVIDTLEASIWCLLKNSSYESTVLSAVNLGDDSDTTGAVVGGLAGLYYGIENIPTDWLNAIARLDDINLLINRYYSSLDINN